jgi:natural product biosynthesis luciferase-like monooxygenase protein
MNITSRVASLSKEQRELLELKLKMQGLSPAFSNQSSTLRPVDQTTSLMVEEDPNEWKRKRVNKEIDLTLYFFSDDGTKNGNDKYRLLLDSAKFADAHGFSAVWTPERHFQDFGGLYPNPSVLSAAIAAITERIQIRAGSVALPLHHPVRVAEEWAVVDNISKGRVAVSFASGWHLDDFVFAPNKYENRKEIMYQHIEVIKKLWAGEAVKFQSAGDRYVDVKIFPRPIQPTLPIWITTAGNQQTWARVGETGANVLGALTGYSFDDLKSRISLYRKTLADNNHDPRSGKVTMMVHTFVGDNNQKIKERVREPLCHYLSSYFKQFENMMDGAVSDEDKNAIIERAFEQFFETSTLIGTPSKCSKLLDRLIEAGVDEVACLVDFGLEYGEVMDSLHQLNDLRKHYSRRLQAVS